MKHSENGLKRWGLALTLVGATAAAQAGTLSLGEAGTFNLYSLGNLTATGTDVMGGVAVAGNLTASSYGVNSASRPGATGAGNYALSVGGAVNYSNGQVWGGQYYPAGGYTNVGFVNATAAAGPGVDFAANAGYLTGLSSAVAGLTATGSVSQQYGGLIFNGSNSAVEIFNLSSTMLQSSNWSQPLQNIAGGASIIVNINGMGQSITLPGMDWSVFNNRNVIFNIVNAPTLTLNNASLLGSVLAPTTTVTGGGGNFNGNIIVGGWDSNVEVHDHNPNTGYNHTWQAVDVPGLTPSGSDSLHPVPEPGSLALLVAGLGLPGFRAAFKSRA